MTAHRPVLVFEGITWVAAPSPAWAALTPPAPARRAVTSHRASAPRQVTPPVQPASPVAPDLAELVVLARPLMPMGRGRLARELGCTADKARKVIEALSREQQCPVALVREA